MARERRIDSGKEGKSFELMVASELLKEQMDIFFPWVDIGCDLVAVSRNKRGELSSKFIQVKGKNEREGTGVYWVHVDKDKFDKWKGLNSFFVFVLRSGNRTDYLVVPTGFLEICFKNKKISKGKYHFYFSFRNGKVVDHRDKRTKIFDYTKFLNKRGWRLLKTHTPRARSETPFRK